MIDVEMLLRTLMAWLRGEPRVCSMVPVPGEADEEARRAHCERHLRRRPRPASRIGGRRLHAQCPRRAQLPAGVRVAKCRSRFEAGAATT